VIASGIFPEALDDGGVTMLEPQRDFRPLAAEDLLEVCGGMDPLLENSVTCCCPRSVGDVAQNIETPPNKLDFDSIIG